MLPSGFSETREVRERTDENPLTTQFPRGIIKHTDIILDGGEGSGIKGHTTPKKSDFPKGAPSGKDIVKFLQGEGFKIVKNQGKQSGKGSHVKMRGPNGETTHVPIHGNKSLDKGILIAIKSQSGYN
jgi:predicted RNA binding protein YcfA (HicA-like mRNA interferase family)